MAALGSADAFAAPHHKHVPAHRSKAAEAERHKHGSASDAKRSAAARQSERKRAAHVVVPSVPLPISLPPDLAAVKLWEIGDIVDVLDAWEATKLKGNML
jgi:hypothetical protein